MENEIFPSEPGNEAIAKLAKEYNDVILKHHQHNELKEQRKFTNKLIKLGEDKKYLPALIMGYLQLSSQESELMQHHQAIKYGLKALKFCKSGNNKKLFARAYSTLGACFGNADDIDKSLEYSLKSLEHQPENPNTLNNLGAIYNIKKEYRKALGYLEKAIAFYRKIGIKSEEAKSLRNIGETHYHAKDYSKAMIAFNKALQIGKDLRNNDIICTSYCCLAEIYYSKKDFEKLEKILLKALDIAEKDQLLNLTSACNLYLAKLYEEKNNIDQALSYQKAYSKTLELRAAKETKEKIDKLLLRAEIEKSEQQEKQQILQKSKQEIEKRYHYLQAAYTEVTSIGKFGIFSDKMQNVVKMAELLHPDRSVPVLIEGDTGTGKEIVARIIHHGKINDSSPFIVINCAAISPSLFESELFGYEAGAFTGAKEKGMIGKFELAQGGTIFLDEIGELPLDMQPKLLRALQQKEIFRIGGNKPIKLDVRVICATNRDLKLEMEEKRFRRDLYFRLNTGRIFIPSLRERQEEIAPLAQMFMLTFASLKKRKFQYIGKPALDILEHYSWPGNIRELENAMERVTLLYNEVELKPNHLNFLELSSEINSLNGENSYLINFPEEGVSFEQLKKDLIKYVVKMLNGNKTHAAKYLNISRTTIMNNTK